VRCLPQWVNAIGLRRPILNRDDETPVTVANVELRIPRNAMRLGTFDPEISEIIWQDEVVDATGS
jgi:hypothetical protein